MTKREISAGGIVFKKEHGKTEVLLIRDSYGRWAWPKGKLQPKESAKEAEGIEIARNKIVREAGSMIALFMMFSPHQLELPAIS